MVPSPPSLEVTKPDEPKRRRRVRRLGFIALSIVALLGIVLLFSLPTIVQSGRVTYEQAEYPPRQARYCPGDAFMVDYEITRKEHGPIQILESWCRGSDNYCLPRSSSVSYAIVFALQPTPVAATIGGDEPLLVPYSVLMLPGEEWVYARSLHSVNGGGGDQFVSRFIIGDDCDTPLATPETTAAPAEPVAPTIGITDALTVTLPISVTIITTATISPKDKKQ